jgi:NifU-like protein involved in Fe-S cluster formation
MVAPRLHEVLVRGEGAGACAGEGVRSAGATHPVCGDHVELSVRRSGAMILEVRWRAAGCPAAMAVAALAAKVLKDVAVVAAAEVLRQAVAAHGGLAAHERHAEAIVLRALAEAAGA